MWKAVDGLWCVLLLRLMPGMPGCDANQDAGCS
jgi:hypothetical protein